MIVITSIFPPSPAVERFALLSPGEVIVVGDRKSPAGWELDGVEFISADEQLELPFRIATALPWNHYCRKNVGYLRAIARGAKVIRESDDDNLALDAWDFPSFEGHFTEVSGPEFVNVYRYYTDQHVWPRGLPLDIVLDETPARGPDTDVNVGIWQGLADGDPDVDAIYRLTVNTPVEFDKGARPVVLAPGTVCPFNSQNTAFSSPAFPLLYLPATVTFRFTDILRGLVAQPILWAAGLRLGFTTATVFQDRNEHDFMRDFVSEQPCYLEARRALKVASRSVDAARSIAGNLRAAYADLAAEGIVETSEIDLVGAWLDDLQTLGHA